MYKIFKNIGLVAIVIVSFMYTENLVSVVKEYDNLMIEIKEKQKFYKKDTIEAKIEEDTIIPGTEGKKVDINESYKKMKQYGKFNEQLIVYKSVGPKKLLIDNKDKYIIKGTKKNHVSIIALIKNDITKVNKIKNKNVNIFIDSKLLINTKSINLINGYEIGITGENHDYYREANNIIKHGLKQKQGYCLTTDKDSDLLKECFKLNNYTILSDFIIKNNILKPLKSNLDNGSIIVINEESIFNIDNIINYIQSKGYKIVNLTELLSEK